LTLVGKQFRANDDEEKKEKFNDDMLGNYDEKSIDAAKITEAVKSVDDPINFILDVIGKEVKKDDKLARQVLYTIFSSGTKNPMNLAINAPSGEGKSYVANKIGALFGDDTVISLSGMTEKALFHKRGMIGVKVDGQYVSLKLLLDPLQKEMTKIEEEKEETKTADEKNELNQEYNELLERVEELENKAVKIIDLQNKVLLFMDTPPENLFSALMPLMSHDKEETTYEFTDTDRGIKTRTNVLRGFPSFIFTQAKDFSGYERAEEIMRRFLISNPNMDIGKYNEAADLIAKKYSVPDYVYQETIVSEEETEKAGLIANKILTDIQKLNEYTKPSKNNVIIPFYETVRKSLNIVKGLDMTSTARIFGCLSLLPIIKSYRRPKLVIEYPTIERNGVPMKEPDLVIPIATFDDLQETLYLMENSTGVRPFIMEWFEKVFMAAFKSKTGPDSKTRGKETVEESMIALTSESLREKHKEVYGKTLRSKQILETYLYPLMNSNSIDCIQSQIDGRAKIYFPINTEKYILLFDKNKTNNLLQDFRLTVADLTIYPSKEYIKSLIQPFLNYSSANSKKFSLKNHKDELITLDELVNEYYSNPDSYFIKEESVGVAKNKDEGISSVKQHSLEEYLQSLQILINSTEITDDPAYFIEMSEVKPIKLFDVEKTNKIILLEHGPKISVKKELEDDSKEQLEAFDDTVSL
jgi:hypothetical protein